MMPLRDKLTLGPIEKYQKYGIFPFKFVNHIFLMFLTFCAVSFVVQPDTDYSFMMTAQLNQLFMSPD